MSQRKNGSASTLASTEAGVPSDQPPFTPEALARLIAATERWLKAGAPTRRQQAAKGHAVLAAHTCIDGRAPEQMHPDDQFVALADALANLRHYADQRGSDFDAALDLGTRHFEYERTHALDEAIA